MVALEGVTVTAVTVGLGLVQAVRAISSAVSNAWSGATSGA